MTTNCDVCKKEIVPGRKYSISSFDDGGSSSENTISIEDVCPACHRRIKELLKREFKVRL